MALPFILGLVIGGGVVYAYNNREELQEQLKARSKDLKSGLKKGQEALGKVRGRAKNLAQSLVADESTQTKGKRKRATKATTAKATKSTAPKTTRRRRVAKAPSATETAVATEATLIPSASN